MGRHLDVFEWPCHSSTVVGLNLDLNFRKTKLSLTADSNFRILSLWIGLDIIYCTYTLYICIKSIPSEGSTKEA